MQLAVDAFRRLDVVVANAGILRDRMLVNMTAEDWDGVLRVHLRGTFCTARWAAAHWRERSWAGTASRPTLSCRRRGPGMTEELFPEAMRRPERGFDAMAPESVSPLVVWLASAESRAVTGRVFELMGGRLGVAEGWRHGPGVQRDAAFEPAELGPVIADLLARAAEPTGLLGI